MKPKQLCQRLFNFAIQRSALFRRVHVAGKVFMPNLNEETKQGNVLLLKAKPKGKVVPVTWAEMDQAWAIISSVVNENKIPIPVLFWTSRALAFYLQKKYGIEINEEEFAAYCDGLEIH